MVYVYPVFLLWLALIFIAAGHVILSSVSNRPYTGQPPSNLISSIAFFCAVLLLSSGFVLVVSSIAKTVTLAIR